MTKNYELHGYRTQTDKDPIVLRFASLSDAQATAADFPYWEIYDIAEGEMISQRDC